MRHPARWGTLTAWPSPYGVSQNLKPRRADGLCLKLNPLNGSHTEMLEEGVGRGD